MLISINTINKKDNYVLMAFLLALFIIGFNSVDIFYMSTMYVDDHHRYILGLEGRLHETILSRNFLRAYVIFPLYKLLAIDPMYARLALVVVFYIPLAFTFYVIYRKYTDLPKVVAFISSVLPCVLPGQYMIPSFIDGSYTIQGLLIYNLAFISAIHFLKHKNSNYLIFISLITILYGASLEMMDHSVFLAPFSIVVFFLISKNNKEWRKLFIVSVVFIVLAGSKAYQIINFPTVSAATPIELSLDIFLARLHQYIYAVLPYAYSLSGNKLSATGITVIFILTVGYALYSSNTRERIYILLALFWALCASITFLTLSKYYSPRYAHISGFGINFAFVYSIYLILNRLFNSKSGRGYYIAIFLILILINAGVSRVVHLYNLSEPKNRVHHSIVSKLSKINYPENSQIVILNGSRIPTGGWWNYSSGYIKYATGRKDLVGLIGPEKFYYDAFIKENRGYRVVDNMNGLDINAPIYIFRLYCKMKSCSLTQLQYALQWENNTWSFLKFDVTNGGLTYRVMGNGYVDLVSKLKQYNVTFEDVAFSKAK